MGVDYIVRHIFDRYVADGILDAVAESGCDLIVMASHGRRGIARFVMGSDANEVLVRSHLPVLICR
jgi:nucleotide-binding universal stress UspA family protein